MRALIDAARKPRDDDVARPARARARAGRRKSSPAAEALRDPTIATAGCCSASSRPREREDRRRRIDLTQDRRIFRLAEGDKSHAELPRRVELPLDLLDRGHADRARRAAAPREFGQRLERRPRAAAIVEKRAKGARPDVLRADEPQPVEPLFVGESRGFRRLRHR